MDREEKGRGFALGMQAKAGEEQLGLNAFVLYDEMQFEAEEPIDWSFPPFCLIGKGLVGRNTAIVADR